MVVLDTNIIIDHLRLSGKGESLLMKVVRTLNDEEFAISVITIQELYEGKSTSDEEKESFMLATINPLKTLVYNYNVSKLAGEIARDLKNPIEFADAAIAATAIENGAALYTANVKHFKPIPSLDLVSIK